MIGMRYTCKDELFHWVKMDAAPQCIVHDKMSKVPKGQAATFQRLLRSFGELT